MTLNKQKGNMYGFVTHTWNPIKGRCPHDCTYCYMRSFWNRMKNDVFRIDEKMGSLGEDRFIFVGSSTDMWIGKTEWISKVLVHIAKYPQNTYLFQTKFPFGYYDWTFYDNQILGITLESNRHYPKISKAINSTKRVADFYEVEHTRKMITIEPIMDFDLKPFVFMIKTLQPEWVNIGADSGGNKLPEPSITKIRTLIDELKRFTKVNLKPNLERIYKE